MVLRVGIIGCDGWLDFFSGYGSNSLSPATHCSSSDGGLPAKARMQLIGSTWPFAKVMVQCILMW